MVNYLRQIEDTSTHTGAHNHPDLYFFCPIRLKLLLHLFLFFCLTDKYCRKREMKLLCVVPLGLHSLHLQNQIYINFSLKRRGESEISTPLHDTRFYLVISICPFCILLPFTRAKWNSHLDIPLWCFFTAKWHFILTFQVPIISMWSYKTCLTARFRVSCL